MRGRIYLGRGAVHVNMANGEWPIGLSMVLPDGPWPMACAVLAVLERYAALRCLSLARGTVGR